jgi:adenosylcobinamide-GDP ribazoletransferase
VIPMTLALFGLLTRIKLTRRDLDLEAAARRQYLFPLVGIVIGLLGSLAILVLDLLFGNENHIVSGGVLVALLYCITGIMHTEGLADLADGVMASGTPERKREVMKDPHAGVAAVMATVLFLIVLFAVATRMCDGADEVIDPWPHLLSVPFVLGMVVSEAAGKLSMTTAMLLGPSSQGGMGSTFVRNASGARFALACAIAAIGCFLIVGWLSILVFTGVVAGAIVTAIARKHLGGVSGDVFGAANEIGRVFALLMWVIVA